MSLGAVLLAGRPARSQDLAGAGPPGPAGALELLEHALPAAAPALAAEAASTRWWGLRELETRAVALGGGWRALRAAAGLSQTGVPDLGWTTLALAAGGATRGAGAAIRVVTRRDRDAPWSPRRALATGSGLELGAGAWLDVAPALRAWASAPQAVSRGGPRPLERPLELGLRVGAGSALWASLRAPRAHDDGERALGMRLDLPPLAAWAEVRDGPLRAAAGISAAAGPLEVAMRADAHPVLGETVRLEVAWRHATGAAP
jgi:hypothetical protein